MSQGKAKHLNAFLDSQGSTVPEEGASEDGFDLTFSEFSFSLGGSIQEFPRFLQVTSSPPRTIELSQQEDFVQQQEEQGRMSFPFQGEQGIAMADADFQEMSMARLSLLFAFFFLQHPFSRSPRTLFYKRRSWVIC